MKIEILFPEFCNLFGDSANMRYLEKCLPEAEFIRTALNDEPYFVKNSPELIYMGPMTESVQEKIIKKFLPLKDRIRELIASGTVFLFTGNALEILGDYIENDDGTKIEALGIFGLYAKRDMLHRHNSECEAEFKGMRIMGFKTQFTMCYPKTEDKGLFKVVKGMGMNMGSKVEGIHVNNFMGTYLVGPLLILNPCFTKYLMELLGVKDKEPYLMDVATEAYNKRLQDFDRNIKKDAEKYKYM